MSENAFFKFFFSVYTCKHDWGTRPKEKLSFVVNYTKEVASRRLFYGWRGGSGIFF